jgi:catechol 2,3-dioxygenase-like lactoylglutathione lyase family enzyme
VALSFGAIAFYTQKLGFELVEDTPLPLEGAKP